MYLLTSILVTYKFKGRILKVFSIVVIIALFFDIVNIILVSTAKKEVYYIGIYIGNIGAFGIYFLATF